MKIRNKLKYNFGARSSLQTNVLDTNKSHFSSRYRKMIGRKQIKVRVSMT